MKSAGKARSNGLYRHIRTSKEIIRNLLNDSKKNLRGCALSQSLPPLFSDLQALYIKSRYSHTMENICHPV